jgi:G:T-mismatch repair DNA endonuclease (very short patch repair protein)
MRNLCQCGCETLLRKDNRTGYQKGHKPCPVCGSLVQGSGLECCSKSCSAKLHWQRNPEMRESRIWNADRYATREKNRDAWIKNLSESCQGRIPWNKGIKGAQIPWNKNLPAEQQPYYGKSHDADYYSKRDKTVFERYGVRYATELAKSAPRSKKEKLLENFLPSYLINQRVSRYKPDYVNVETKHIIEVYGDYWHCNPKYFDANFYHTQLKKTAAEKWQEDKQRNMHLESLGYSVTVVWESDLEDFIRTLQ